jgi:hypothetical protein
VDHGTGTIVPKPSESVFAEAVSPEGNQQLIVINPPGDSLLLQEVGSEGGYEESGTIAAQAVGPDSCTTRPRAPGVCA